MRRMRPTGSKGGCATVDGSAAHRTRISRRRCREGKVNVADPDSRPIPVGFGFVQGYNAQTAVNEQHIVLAAEITNISTDFSQLAPIVDAVLRELERAGIRERPEAMAADAGYWNEQQMDEVVADRHIPVLVAPEKGNRDTPKRWLNSGRAHLDASSARIRARARAIREAKTDRGAALRRHQTQQGFHPLSPPRQGEGATEFRLPMMAHNLTKVHRHQLAAVGA